MALGTFTPTQGTATSAGLGDMHFIQAGEIASTINVSGNFTAHIAVEASGDEGLHWFGMPVYNLTTGEQTLFIDGPGVWGVNHNANITHIRTPIVGYQRGEVTILVFRADTPLGIPAPLPDVKSEPSHAAAYTAEITAITSTGAVAINETRRTALFVQNTGDVLLEVYYCQLAAIASQKPVAVLSGGATTNDGLGAALTDDEYTGAVTLVAPSGVGRALVTIY